MKKLAEILQVEEDWFPQINDGWQADEDYLIIIAKHILDKKPRIIVEAGSGLSTVVMARAMQVNNFEAKLTSMEHLPEYRERTLGWLKERNIGHYVNLKCFELTGVPAFYRYNFRISRIDMMVVDGPPSNVHPMARYGAKRLFKSLSPGASVFLDDLNRPGERAIHDIWGWELKNFKFTKVETKRGLLVLEKERGDKQKVLVSVPHIGWIHSDVFHTVYKCMEDERFDVNYELSRASPNSVNYCKIAKIVRDEGYDWWLNIDDDNPPLRNPLDLIYEDKDIIGCPTMVWKENRPEEPFHWNAYTYNEEADNYITHIDQEGLQRVDAVGMGCTLIRGDILRHPDMQHQPFMREYSDDGCTVMKGTDIKFCENARKAGYEIWTHYNYLCLHHKEIELNSAVALIGALAERHAHAEKR